MTMMENLGWLCIIIEYNENLGAIILRNCQ